MDMHIDTHGYVCKDTQGCICTHTIMYAHTGMHACGTHRCTHTQLHTQTHTVMPTHRHTASHTQTCSHMAGYEDAGLHTSPWPAAGAQKGTAL